MARSIGMAAEAVVFRAVVQIPETPYVGAYTKYEGPYGSEGAAKARVSFWIQHWARRDRVATGHVESGTLTWTEVPGTRKDGAK
jgi:hypothetical protein